MITITYKKNPELSKIQNVQNYLCTQIGAEITVKSVMKGAGYSTKNQQGPVSGALSVMRQERRLQKTGGGKGLGAYTYNVLPAITKPRVHGNGAYVKKSPKGGQMYEVITNRTMPFFPPPLNALKVGHLVKCAPSVSEAKITNFVREYEKDHRARFFVAQEDGRILVWRIS